MGGTAGRKVRHLERGEICIPKWALIRLTLLNAPWGKLTPRTHRLHCPGSRLILVAGVTCIRDIVLVGHFGSDKPESMRVNKSPGNTLSLDLRHVACDAFTPDAAILVVRVLFQGCGMRAVR